jgi:tetratricopeptide (TPR) repeat protein
MAYLVNTKMANAESASDIYDRFRRLQEKQWEKLAGENLQEMFGSKLRAMALLRHSSSAIRRAAIEVLEYYWKTRGPEFAHTCEEFATTDDDILVRQSAILALGHCYVNSDDVRVSAILASILRNEAEPQENRVAAYMSLLLVRRGESALKELKDIALQFSLDAVDWEFVDDSMNTSRAPVPVDPLGPYLANISDSEVKSVRLYDQAMEALARGEYKLATEQLSDAIALSPNAATAYVARAHAFIELGKLDRAIADLTYAIRQNGELVTAYRERARVYRLLGKDELADDDDRTAKRLGH